MLAALVSPLLLVSITCTRTPAPLARTRASEQDRQLQHTGEGGCTYVSKRWGEDQPPRRCEVCIYPKHDALALSEQA